MDARTPRYGRFTIRRPARGLVAALVTIGVLLSMGTGSASAASLGCADDGSGTTDLSAWIPEMLAATNAHRTGMGLVALQLDPTLAKAATWKSRDMARRDYFDHIDQALGDAPARTPWDRLAACGWTQGGSRAENIAAGQQSGTDFVTAWLNSPGHRANIEDPSMRYVGFGVASSTTSTYGTYATQMFASVAGPAVAPDPLRTPYGGGDAIGGDTTAPTTPAVNPPTLRSATAVIARHRCRGALAVAGWCWTIAVGAQLVAADGSSLAGQRIAVSRRTATGRYMALGTATTNGAGTFTLSRALRPPTRVAEPWLRRNAGTLRIVYAGSGTFGPTTSAVTSRITS